MNYRNMTLDELLHEVELDGSPLALELRKRVEECEEALREAKAEIVDLENGPLCSDDDHCDFEHYKSFFEDVREIVGINPYGMELYEVADALRENIHGAFD